jgi:hypothetical protein
MPFLTTILLAIRTYSHDRRKKTEFVDFICYFFTFFTRVGAYELRFLCAFSRQNILY